MPFAPHSDLHCASWSVTRPLLRIRQGHLVRNVDFPALRAASRARGGRLHGRKPIAHRDEVGRGWSSSKLAPREVSSGEGSANGGRTRHLRVVDASVDLGRFRQRSVCRFELTPPTCPVVGDDRSEHCDQRLRVDRLSSTQGDCPCGLVLVARADDPVRVGNHRAVVEENVDVVLRGQQRAHVSVQDEVRQLVALDRFGDLRSAAWTKARTSDVLLPVRQRVDVGVYASISRVGHGSLEDSPGGLDWQAQTTPPNRSRPRHHRRLKRRERDLRDHLTDQGRVI